MKSDDESSFKSESAPTGEEETTSDGPFDRSSEEGSPRNEVGQLRKVLRRQFAMHVENVIPEDVQRILDQVETRLQSLKEKDDVKFAGRVYKRIQLLGRMLMSWAEGSFTMPWRSVAAVAGTILYLTNPMDVLPEFMKDEGLLDDALVIYLCYTLVDQDLHRYMNAHGINPSEYGFTR